MISLGQVIHLSPVDCSSVGPLVVDLVNRRSSRDLDICDPIDAQLASTSSYSFQVKRPHNKCPPVLWSPLVIARLCGSLELTTCLSFNAHNDRGLVCTELNEEGVDVEGM